MATKIPDPNTAISKRPDSPPEPKDIVEGEKHRVKNACVPCRTRKIKCPGELPCCSKCAKAGMSCVYAESRRDRLKEATEQNRQLVMLLKDLSLRVDDQDTNKINQLLDSLNKKPTPQTRSTQRTQSRDAILDEESSGGEARVPGSVGSNQNVDIVDEDMFRSHDSKATGFVGQNSEVQWLRSLKQKIRQEDDQPIAHETGPATQGANAEVPNPSLNAWSNRQEPRQRGETHHVTDSTFYLDRNILDIDVMVDEYELPPTQLAEKLFECYWKTIHVFFPILPLSYRVEFENFIVSVRQQQSVSPPKKWLAILNLVFAIGSQFCSLTGIEWSAPERDHLIYTARAMRLLELNNTFVAISAPDLALIQATGLLSMYYLVIGHINRAWVMIGFALRSALAVGLHLRNEDQSASPAQKETLVQIWWGLHSTECLVSAMTGRPCVIASEDCTVPFPQMLPEINSLSNTSSEANHPGSSVEMSIVDAHIKHRLIIQKTIELLYTPRAARCSWGQTQKAMAMLVGRLDDWAKYVFPQGLDRFDLDAKSHDSHRLKSQHELSFAFSLFSAQILVTRPSLCRLERRIQGQSSKSVKFNQSMAEICIEAAQDLAMLLPETPDPPWLYRKGPWWCIVHYIMQAMSVLLLEFSYGGTRSATIHPGIPKSVKKLISWLRCMRHKNDMAERAYAVIIDTLKSSPHVSSSMSDLLVQDELMEDNPLPNSGFQAPAAGLNPDFSVNNDAPPQGYIDPSFQAWLPSDQLQSGLGQFDQNSIFQSGFPQMPASYGGLFSTSYDQLHPLVTQSMEGLQQEPWPGSLEETWNQPES